MPNLSVKICTQNDLFRFVMLTNHKEVTNLNLFLYQLHQTEPAAFRKLVDSISDCVNLESIDLSLTGIGKLSLENISAIFDALSMSRNLSRVELVSCPEIFLNESSYLVFMNELAKLEHITIIVGIETLSAEKRLPILNILKRNLDFINSFKAAVSQEIDDIIPVSGVRDIIVDYVPPMMFSEKLKKKDDTSYGCFRAFCRVGKVFGL